MMDHCPKCQSHELYTSPGAPVGQMNRIYQAGLVTYLVCCECGYTEAYLMTKMDRRSVSASWDMVREVNLEASEDREILPVSMLENQCPACGAADIRQSQMDDSLRIDDDRVAALTHLVCLNCGHVEKYVMSAEDRDAIATHWSKASRPPTPK